MVVKKHLQKAPLRIRILILMISGFGDFFWSFWVPTVFVRFFWAFRNYDHMTKKIGRMDPQVIFVKASKKVVILESVRVVTNANERGDRRAYVSVRVHERVSVRVNGRVRTSGRRCARTVCVDTCAHTY